MNRDEALKTLLDLIDDQPSGGTAELHAAIAALSSPYGGKEIAKGWAHEEVWYGGPEPEQVWIVHTKPTPIDSDLPVLILPDEEGAKE